MQRLANHGRRNESTYSILFDEVPARKINIVIVGDTGLPRPLSGWDDLCEPYSPFDGTTLVSHRSSPSLQQREMSERLARKLRVQRESRRKGGCVFFDTLPPVDQHDPPSVHHPPPKNVFQRYKGTDHLRDNWYIEPMSAFTSSLLGIRQYEPAPTTQHIMVPRLQPPQTGSARPAYPLYHIPNCTAKPRVAVESEEPSPLYLPAVGQNGTSSVNVQHGHVSASCRVTGSSFSVNEHVSCGSQAFGSLPSLDPYRKRRIQSLAPSELKAEIKRVKAENVELERAFVLYSREAHREGSVTTSNSRADTIGGLWQLSARPAKPVVKELNLGTLIEALMPLDFSRSNHGQLARALGVSEYKLSEIEANNPHDIAQVRTGILKEWLQTSQDEPTWETLARAVRHTGDVNLSGKLMAYKKPEETPIRTPLE